MGGPQGAYATADQPVTQDRWTKSSWWSEPGGFLGIEPQSPWGVGCKGKVGKVCAWEALGSEPSGSKLRATGGAPREGLEEPVRGSSTEAGAARPAGSSPSAQRLAGSALCKTVPAAD